MLTGSLSTLEARVTAIPSSRRRDRRGNPVKTRGSNYDSFLENDPGLLHRPVAPGKAFRRCIFAHKDTHENDLED